METQLLEDQVTRNNKIALVLFTYLSLIRSLSSLGVVEAGIPLRYLANTPACGSWWSTSECDTPL